jgi:hypothetical protein
MNPIEKGNVEILIHTTAPSRGADDVRYRSLAQSYLDFRPTKRRKVEEYPAGGGLELNAHAGSQQHGNRQESTQEERDSEASWQPDEDGHESISQQRPLNDLDLLDITELLDSPELSFLSVMDNRASPAFRAPVTWRHTSSAEGRPGSEVPDSQPERNPTLAAFSSPTRILEVFLQNRDSSSSGPSTESHRYPGSLELPINSQGNTFVSPTSHSHNRNQDNISLEVHLSSEERSSSSQHLLQHRTEELGSPELGADRTGPILSNQSSSSAEAGREKGNFEVKARTKRLSSQSLPKNQSGAESGLQFGVIKQSALQSSQITTSDSSPSPLKPATKQPERALRSKSPNTPYIQDQQLGGKRKLLATISETQISSSAPPALALNDVLDPRPAKKQRLEAISSPIKAIANTPTSSNLSIPSGTRPRTTAWSEKLEIRPPPPQTSTGELKAEMLISPKLHDMATKWPLENYYHPKKDHTRDLKPMERGYWFIDCSTWTEEIRHGCWNFLGEMIGSGRAGWGVWCVRDTTLESFRVYCWGIVAGHIYLVLKAASLNKIVKSGACWTAGDGKVIIKMCS